MTKKIDEILEDVFNEGYDAGKGVLAEDEEEIERKTIAEARQAILEAIDEIIGDNEWTPGDNPVVKASNILRRVQRQRAERILGLDND